MNSAIDCFPGIAHVELGVLAPNINAIAFYKSLGFFEAGPEPKAKDEPPSIKMTKAL
jgi:RimJ/RimL family protein N-acetyltransferase